MNPVKIGFCVLFCVFFFNVSAQDNMNADRTSEKKWFIGSDLTSYLRANSGFNIQSGFQREDKIYTFSIDMFTHFNYGSSDKYHGPFGNHFQISYNKKYLKNKKANRFFQKYDGYEIAYSRAKFENYIRVYEENGIWKRSYSGRTEGTVPGIVFLQSRLKLGYIFGFRHSLKSGLYFDASMGLGVSFYYNQEVSYPYKHVIEPSYSGPPLFPAGSFDGLDFIGSVADKFFTHSIVQINEGGVALAFQGRIVVGYSF